MFIYYCLSAACINYLLVESILFENIRNYIINNKWPIFSYSLTCYMCTGIQVGLLIGIIMEHNIFIGLAIGYLSCIIIDIKNILEASKPVLDDVYMVLEAIYSKLLTND